MSVWLNVPAKPRLRTKPRDLALVLGCITALSLAGAAAVAATPMLPPPDGSETTAAPVSEYKISPLDKLNISVFAVPDLTGEVAVDAAGQISLPLIGSVQAGGKTVAELRADVAHKLAAKYLQDPQVTVSVKESAGQRITVDGAVMQAGVYPITGATTLMSAVAMARGSDPTRANDHKVILFRVVKGQRLSATYDLAAIREGKSPDPPVYANDTIIVDVSRGRSVMHDVISASPFVTLLRVF